MKRVRLVVLAVAVAAAIAIAAYLALRPVCESDRSAMRGEVRRAANGTFRYFDGQCWTTKPLPPRDTPF